MSADPAAGGFEALQVASPIRPGTVQGTDLGLAFLHRTLLQLVDGPYGLQSVDLPYRPPAPRETYEEFFGAPVRFGRA